MDENLDIVDGYIDGCTLSRKELDEYDIDKTYNNVIKKINELKKARNRFLNGYHLRITANYTPKLSNYVPHKIDIIGDEVANKIDSEEAYNKFNIKLEKLLQIMSLPERAYITECLLSNEKEYVIKDKFVLTRRKFETIKDSSIVRLALAFCLEEYKN